MTTKPFTLDDLKRILLAAAGGEEGVDLDSDFLDSEFEALGYESLALLETGGQIEREFGVALEDDLLTVAATPRALITYVNARLPVTPAT